MLLLPWRVQCPGRVREALAAALGGRGCRFLLLPLGSSLPSRAARCVLRVVPPGCPFPSPAGTPLHAVYAFRGLGPVVLRVRAAFPLLVCALVLPRRTRLPTRLGQCVARALRAVPEQGARRALPGGWCPSTLPAPVPCSAYLALGGVARSLRPRALLGVARLTAGRPAFVTYLCALWGRHEDARGGGVPHALVWGARRWALSHARPPVLGACGRGPLPTGCRCGGCGRGDPSPTPQRALLRAGFTR